MDREAQEARTIQQALLPKSSPYIPGFAVSGLSVPAGRSAATGTTSFPSPTGAGDSFWPTFPEKELRRPC